MTPTRWPGCGAPSPASGAGGREAGGHSTRWRVLRQHLEGMSGARRWRPCFRQAATVAAGWLRTTRPDHTPDGGVTCRPVPCKMPRSVRTPDKVGAPPAGNDATQPAHMPLQHAGLLRVPSGQHGFPPRQRPGEDLGALVRFHVIAVPL